MTYSPARFAWSCLLSLMLVVGLMPGIVLPQKAYADTTITSVNVNVDFSKVVLNSAVTGKEANQLFRDYRSLDEATSAMVTLDYTYSFLAEKKGTSSTGAIIRKRLWDSDELLTETIEKAEDGTVGTAREYYLIFNLIQKKGFEFPEGNANLPLAVTVNGASYSGIQVDRYNSDSVDVYVPIAFNTIETLTAVKISNDLNSDYIQAGKYTNLSLKEVGKTKAGYDWTMTGGTQAGTNLSSYGPKLIVDSAEPAGTKLTVTATSKAFPEISDSMTLTVITEAPAVEKISVTAQESDGVTPAGNNAVVDVTSGYSRTVDFKVEVEGTAGKSFTADLLNASNKSTKVTKNEEGFQVSVSGSEPSGSLRVIVASSADSTKRCLVTITVKGVPRINYIDLAVDTTKIYRSLSTQTGADLRQYFSNDYITSSGMDTYVDFSNNSQYSYIAKKSVDGSGKTVYTKVADDETLATGEEYYVVLNIENKEGGTKSYWPDDKDSISVYVNGRRIGVDGYGELDWYSQTMTGSLIVRFPLGGKGTYDYGSIDLAPGVKAAYYKGVEPSRGLDRFAVMTYKGATMYYAYDTETWYYPVSCFGSDPVGTDFASAYIDSQDFYPYEVSKPGNVRWDTPGDIDASGKVDIIDAQMVSDIAAGGVYTLGNLDAKRWIASDVNGDNRVDAYDVRTILKEMIAYDGSYPARNESSAFSASLATDASEVAKGSTFDVKLASSSSDYASPLSCGQYAISYDDSVVSLAASDISVNGALSCSAVQASSGMVFVGFCGNGSNSLSVATLKFKAIAEGDPQITICDAAAGSSGSANVCGVAYSVDPLAVTVASSVRAKTGSVFAEGSLSCKVLSDGTVSVSVDPTQRKTVATLVIPATVKDGKGNSYKVTSIAKNGFKGCTKLTSVKINSKWLTSIGAYAFSGCGKLKSFSASSKVLASIGTKAFYKTKSLTTVSIGKTAKLKKVSGAFKSAGKSGGKKLTVKVKSSNLKTYKKLITKKGGNKKLKVKKA